MLRRAVWSDERGQVLPLVALMLVVLLGAGAMAIDVAYWRYQQRLEQSAADSAAIAGAGELANPGFSAATVLAAAAHDATANGFTNGPLVTVTVNNPPTSGNYQSNAAAVEVIIDGKQPAFLGGILGVTNQSVSVRAVAVLKTTDPACMYALNGDITLNGGNLSATTCGIVTNNNLNVTGNATVDARFVGYVGSGPGGGSYPHGQPMRTIAASDPCASISGCADLAALTSAQLHTGCMPQSPLPNPLPPGEYCQALSLGGAETFSPGLFVLDGGLSADGNATLTGSGVTLYNAGSLALTGTTFAGNVNISIAAPTTGPYAGMVFYQPATNSNPFTLSGRAGTDNFAGGVYLPTAALTVNGNIPNMTLLVAASIALNGGGMGINSAGLPTSGHGVLAE